MNSLSPNFKVFYSPETFGKSSYDTGQTSRSSLLRYPLDDDGDSDSGGHHVGIILDAGLEVECYSPVTKTPRPKGFDKLLDYILTSPDPKCLLLTSASPSASAALPLLYRLWREGGKTYPFPTIISTAPVRKMTQLNLYDVFSSASNSGRTHTTVQDIDDVVGTLKGSGWVELKYSQPKVFQNLTVTAKRSGCSVGGSYFLLTTSTPKSTVVYAPKYSHRTNICQETDLKLGHAQVDCVITYPGGTGSGLGEGVSALRRQKKVKKRMALVGRDKELTSSVHEVLKRGGNVILPVEALSEIAEPLLVLQNWLKDSSYSRSYRICVCSNVGEEWKRFLKAMLEWTRIGDEFDRGGANPFNLQGIEFFSRFNDILEDDNDRPVVLFGTSASLMMGPCAAALTEWGGDEDNGIIFTSSQFTLGARSTLLKEWCGAKSEGREMVDELEVKSWKVRRMFLEGEEVAEYERLEETRQEKLRKDMEKQAVANQIQSVKEHLGIDVAEEKEENIENGGRNENANADSNISNKATADVRTPSASSGKVHKMDGENQHMSNKKPRFDSTLFMKFSRPQHTIFPVNTEAMVSIGKANRGHKVVTDFRIIDDDEGEEEEKLDDYGVTVDPEQFMDLVSGIDRKGGKVADEALKMGYIHVTLEEREDLRNLKLSHKGKTKEEIEVEEESEEKREKREKREEIRREIEDLSEGHGIIRGRNGRSHQKVFSEVKNTTVKAEVHFIPYDAMVDSESSRYIISALRPRQCVILGSSSTEPNESASELMLLANAVRPTTTNKDSVYTPTPGELLDLNVGSAAFSVRLVEEPYVSNPEEYSEDFDFSTLTGQKQVEATLGNYTVSLVDSVANGKKTKGEGNLVFAPKLATSSSSKDALNKPTVMLSNGDVLLTDLRSEFLDREMKAEYSVNAEEDFQSLLVNGSIVIRRDGKTGHLTVEGPLCEDWFTCRAVLYSQYVML
mmetsp:Transcript_7944/g.15974  ORF Transcript_7944/g.15974 Transcript_7944/m.15974 type:complete len:960 (-) Transcript_7944:58-2937(-)